MKANMDIGGKVYPSRPLPIFFQELPICLVYFTTEQGDFEMTAPRIYKRRLEIVTEVVQQIETEREMGLDDYLDSRAYEIEHALLDDRFLGLREFVQDTVMERTEVINLSSDGGITAASLRIFWVVTYVDSFHYEGNLDEFLKFQAKYKATNGAEAEDLKTIRTE